MKDVTPEDLMGIVQRPELVGDDCDKHKFYIGQINGRMGIVYCEAISKNHHDVVCASWLYTEEELEVMNKWETKEDT